MMCCSESSFVSLEVLSKCHAASWHMSKAQNGWGERNCEWSILVLHFVMNDLGIAKAFVLRISGNVFRG